MRGGAIGAGVMKRVAVEELRILGIVEGGGHVEVLVVVGFAVVRPARRCLPGLMARLAAGRRA